jgi:hypothetical protein
MSAEPRSYRFHKQERSLSPVPLVPIQQPYKPENLQFTKKVLKKVYGIKPATEKPLKVITPHQRIRFLCIDAPMRQVSNKASISDENTYDNSRSSSSRFGSRRRVVRLHDGLLNPVLGKASRLRSSSNDRDKKIIEISSFN